MLYKRTIPITIEFYYEPEEKATEFEEGCEEFFEIEKFLIGNKNVASILSREIDEEILNYLKESKDE